MSVVRAFVYGVIGDKWRAIDAPLLTGSFSDPTLQIEWVTCATIEDGLRTLSKCGPIDLFIVTNSINRPIRDVRNEAAKLARHLARTHAPPQALMLFRDWRLRKRLAKALLLLPASTSLEEAFQKHGATELLQAA